MGFFKIVAWVALVCLVWHPVCLRGQVVIYEYFSGDDLLGLQSLWEAWSPSTPSLSSNLLFWQSQSNGTPFPCYNSDQNWRGVSCLRYEVNETVWNTWVVGLELNDASLSGYLPSGIQHLDHLVSLKLTGNPNLTGTLPDELGSLPLNIIDLHDNGFVGVIPDDIWKMGDLVELDLSGNQFSGDFPFQAFGQMTTCQVLNIARNSFTGTVPSNAFENMTQLLTLDISGNHFNGPPPIFVNYPNSTLYNLNLSHNDFSNLPELSQIFKSWLPPNVGVLDLSGLNISGELPDWNAHPELLSREELYLDDINVRGVLDITSILSSNQTLTVLSLMNNSITDVIFDKQFLVSTGKTKFYLGGNPYCTTASADVDGRKCFCDQYCAITVPRKKMNYMVVISPTVVGGVALLSVIFCLVLVILRKSKKVDALVKRLEDSDVRAKRYDYQELRAATENFSEERKLGKGAYGAVYRGIFKNKTQVAVKKIFLKSESAGEDFLNEVLLITNLQHRNLVSLKGYCLHGKEMLLVYELVDFCDLDKLLFRGRPFQVGAHQFLGWTARKRICLDIAQGLYYLHASSLTKIIHRDIKASNILLDKDLHAKIADFGLARPMEDQDSAIVTENRAGTPGYIAPEYILYGQLSEKSDVYSFGVLLLEIVSGTRNKVPVHTERDPELPQTTSMAWHSSLVLRAWKLHKEDRSMELVDPRLRVSSKEEQQVRRVVETAVMCVQQDPEKRPTMFRVVAMLAGDCDGDDDGGRGEGDVEDGAHGVPVVDVQSESRPPPGSGSSSQFRSEDRLLSTASSSSPSWSRSFGSRPFTNGNANLELASLQLPR